MCLALALTGCQPPTGPASSTPSGPAGSASATPALDLTVPGTAQRVVRDLVKASGSQQVIMVDIRLHEASVSVLLDGAARTWASRDGKVKEVPSDLTYVDQIAFDPSAFNLADVGAIFRAAAAVSGSDKAQELQIVDRQLFDHSPSDVLMSVSTNPETRTVFFRADGTLVPTLDFNTSRGIAEGLKDAVGLHTSASALVVGSATGAYIEFTGPDSTTTARRQRTARFPVTVTLRNESDKLTPFDPSLVDPAVVWAVLQRYTATGAFDPTTTWSVTADRRSSTGTLRLRFIIGSSRLVTDLAGNEVRE